VLKAPPPVYFTPADGIRPAPEDLTLAVRQQIERMGNPPFRPPGPPPGVPGRPDFLSPGTPPVR